MSSFDEDTRVEGADGNFKAVLSRNWEVWGPNGGYLAAIALRAVGAESRLRPASFSCHYLRTAEFGEVALSVTPEHKGRRAESWRVQMRQGDRAILTALVRTVGPGPSLDHEEPIAPLVPEPQACPLDKDLWKTQPEQNTRIWDNFERRVLQPENFVRPRSERLSPHYRCWFRLLADATLSDPYIDAGRALVILDTLCWPAVWRTHLDDNYMAPSLDLTAWFHRVGDTTPWLLGLSDSPIGARGAFGATCRIFDSQRRLLASGGSQMLYMPFK